MSFNKLATFVAAEIVSDVLDEYNGKTIDMPDVIDF